MVLNANILKNWTSVTEILIGIFSVLEEMGFDKCISQVVWKEAKELAKLRGENMKMHRVKAWGLLAEKKVSVLCKLESMVNKIQL